MSAPGYALEHLYYGQFLRGGKAEGELRLLAHSAGISQDSIPDIFRASILPPLPASPVGAWGIVRGKNAPFILTQSQLGEGGAAMLHFVLMPVDALRAVSGNMKILMSLLEERMPSFDRMGERLPPLALPPISPPSASEQADAMLALMSCTQDKLDVVEALLAAIIQGVPISVHNAPANPLQRASFVEGLLALLPPPARFGVTFAMHTLQSTRVDAQIRFAGVTDADDEATIFDWQAARVSGNVVSDEYSRYTVSQLRLDTSRVLEQNAALTSVAAWRIKRGDTLAEALRYAAYRLKLDNALLNHQPVDAQEVARVLNEDPTLTDKLRSAYARHVLAFALALNDMTHADPIAIMLPQQTELERTALEQLHEALQNGKALIVYQAVSRWLANPLGPKGMEWTTLVQAAALAHLNRLASISDSAAIQEFLHQLHNTDAHVELGTIIPQLIETALPFMVRDNALARTLFLLGAEYLSPELFLRMATGRSFLGQMPEALARFGTYLDEDASAAPAGLLARAASSFGEAWDDLVTLRLTEAALQANRIDLLDTTALAALAKAARSKYAHLYEHVFRWAARTLSTDERLPKLEDPAPRYVLQLLLARRAYPELAHELLRHSRILYSADRQGDYALMVRRLFLETPLGTDETVDSLRLLEAGGVKPLPLAMAHLGALKRNNWADALGQVAANVTTILTDNPTSRDGVPLAALLELLHFHVRRRDTGNSTRTASLFPFAAARRGAPGAAFMVEMHKLLNWDKAARAAAMENLRRYVRAVDGNYAVAAVMRLGDELGERVRQSLEATYAFRLMLGGEDMPGYAMLIHLTALFLQDTALAYAEKRQIPGPKTLMGDLHGLSGGLSDEDRITIAKTMLALGRTLVLLGKQQRQTRPRDLDKHINRLIAGEVPPLNALDALRVMGGYFARGTRLPSPLEHQPGVHPLGDRAAPSLLWESQAITRLLRNLLRAFPVDEKVTLNADAIREEIESLWGDITLPEQRKLVHDLAADLQAIPELATLITDKGDARAMEDDSGLARKLDANRQHPENTLEFYRFVHGYFKMRVKNG